MNNLTPPSSFKSSEFYMSLSGIVSGMGVAFGFLTSAEADTIVQAVGAIIGGLITLGSIVVQIKSRTELKKEYIKSGNTAPLVNEVVGGTNDSASGKAFEVVPN